MLLPVLADAGHLDTAYSVLLSDGVPAWLHMISHGATTIWEWWDGITAGAAHGSLNHYSKGAVIAFLYTHITGIRLFDEPSRDEAGYRRFVVEPRPGGGLTWADAEHLSPYGPIRSSWHCAANELALVVEVPPGTTAEIRLLDGRTVQAGPGRHELTSDLGNQTLQTPTLHSLTQRRAP